MHNVTCKNDLDQRAVHDVARWRHYETQRVGRRVVVTEQEQLVTQAGQHSVGKLRNTYMYSIA